MKLHEVIRALEEMRDADEGSFAKIDCDAEVRVLNGGPEFEVEKIRPHLMENVVYICLGKRIEVWDS